MIIKKLSFFSIIFMFVFICISTTPVLVSQAKPKEELTFVLVHSYNPSFICTAPQRLGILEALKSISNDYDLVIKDFYMKTKLVHITDNQKNKIAYEIMNRIKEINPDYIFTTDDNAFRYVGIELSNKYKIIASGLNRPFDEYEINYGNIMNLNNIIFIPEIIYLDQLFKILNSIQLQPHHFYILYDNTPTSYFLMKNYEREITGKFNFTHININSRLELNRFLEKIKDQPKSILMIALQSLFDQKANDGAGANVPKEVFFDDFRRHNHQHLEVLENPLYSKVGFSLSCGPDFYDMGKISADYLVNKIIKQNEPFKHEVITPIMTITINVDRLKQLGYMNIANSAINIISEVYRGVFKFDQ